VILVEPPGGSPARRLAPFYKGEPHPDRSLWFWALNRNKRSITLDLDRKEGKTQLKKLVASADFLVESEDPSLLALRGLGYADLAAINPALVYVSITAFGQDGPKAKWAASDLTALAAAGPLLLGGDEDRPPVRITVPQAFLHAGADAAAAALIAHHERLYSGQGFRAGICLDSGFLAASSACPQSRRGKQSCGRGEGGIARSAPSVAGPGRLRGPGPVVRTRRCCRHQSINAVPLRPRVL